MVVSTNSILIACLTGWWKMEVYCANNWIIRKEKFTWSHQVAISWYGMDSDLFGNMWEYFLFIKLELAVKNVMTKFIKLKQVAKGNCFLIINLKESHPLLSNILYLYSKTFWIVGPNVFGNK